MQVRRSVAIGTGLMLVFSALSAQAALYKWVDQHGVTRYGDRAPIGAEAEQIRDRPPEEAAAGVATDDPDAEAKEKIRQDLLERDQARAAQRQANCEQARAEIKRLSDIPARNVMRTDAEGNITRLSEEQLQAELESLRKVETENCA